MPAHNARTHDCNFNEQTERSIARRFTRHPASFGQCSHTPEASSLCRDDATDCAHADAHGVETPVRAFSGSVQSGWPLENALNQ
jgi:hypothetical protein